MGTYKTGISVIDSYTMYTIKSGDTLSEIADRNNIPLQQLLKTNPQFTQQFERNIDVVHHGEKVLIPPKNGIVIKSSKQRYIYTCNCGWIDKDHLRDPSLRANVGARNLWEQVKNENNRVEKKGQVFNKITYTQDMGIKGIPIAGITKTYCFPLSCSLDQKKSIALAIFEEVSLEFEAFQGKIPLRRTKESSFSSEDLVSNLLGFYMAVNGYTEEFIMMLCKPISEKTTKSIPDPHTRQNRTFTPIFHDNDECDKPKFPSEFKSIKPASKGKDFFKCDDLIPKGGNSKKHI